MQLVDSNLVFSLLAGSSPWHRVAREPNGLDDDRRTEAQALLEASNILSRHVRAREPSTAQALAVMTEADERLRPLALRVGHVDALCMAIKHKVTAYDVCFLLGAERLGVRLITEDLKLRHAAPRLTNSLSDALAAAQGWAAHVPPASLRPQRRRQARPHASHRSYTLPGRITLAVKVIDIFGNDTMTLVPVNLG